MASRAKQRLLEENIYLIKENIDMQKDVLQLRGVKQWNLSMIDALNKRLSEATSAKQRIAESRRLYKIGFWVSVWVIALILLLIK